MISDKLFYAVCILFSIIAVFLIIVSKETNDILRGLVWLFFWSAGGICYYVLNRKGSKRVGQGGIASITDDRGKMMALMIGCLAFVIAGYSALPFNHLYDDSNRYTPAFGWIIGTISILFFGFGLIVSIIKLVKPRVAMQIKGSESPVISFSKNQLTISQLEGKLELLSKGKTEFDFLGIHSSGVDCIYFTKVDDKFNIEFEAMDEGQIPFIEKLKEYARSRGFPCSVTTYGNKPHYNSVKESPVVRIETKTNLTETVKIANEIEKAIFGNNDETVYEVVP